MALLYWQIGALVGRVVAMNSCRVKSPACRLVCVRWLPVLSEVILLAGGLVEQGYLPEPP